MSNETANNQDSTESGELSTILCIYYKQGKIAAAYYRINERVLYVFNDMVDPAPGHITARSLFRQLQPKHVATLGNICDPFTKSIINLVNDQDTHTTIDSDQLRSVPNKMTLLPYGEYTPPSCEYRVKSLHLLSEPENLDDGGRELYLRSLINFESKLSMYVLGALIKFIEKSWAHISAGDNDQLCFYHVIQMTLEDNVFIDFTTFNALHVFQKMRHDSGFKHGRQGSSREGTSLFRLFSQYCRSKVGYLKMRNIMLMPIKNIDRLNERLDFIKFILHPQNRAFVEVLEENLKQIEDLDMILIKIHNSRGTCHDWEILYRTIYHILHLKELCAPYAHVSPFFSLFVDSVTDSLYGIEMCIDNTMDFKTKNTSNRVIIKEGLDTILDKSTPFISLKSFCRYEKHLDKLMKDNTKKHVEAAARIVLEQLPDYLKECTVIYIPDMGHVISVKRWEENCDPKELINFGFQFMFELNESLHYKNPLCQELDKYLADIVFQILTHENRIIERVAGFVKRFNNYIREPLQLLGLIDCLIAMSKVATEKGYVCPQLNQDNVHEIKDGRHPLVELYSSNYVANDFFSGGSYSHMKIITGPNASGKSVYLKQTVIIIYLAHIGSFLPVASANVAMVHSIHSRMHATESAVLHLSAFMIDLMQMAQALYNARESSLVLMDEFGRGTTGHGGLALLTGALLKFLKDEAHCPHVMVSTHLEIYSCMFDTPLVQYQKLEYSKDPDTNGIVFLYKVVDGISTSYAVEIANSVGLHADVISRAAELLSSAIILPVQSAIPQGYNVSEEQVDDRFLKDIVIPEFDN